MSLREFYKTPIPADSMARAIVYAVEQPAEVEIDEVLIRPTSQNF
jgi:NADP-dependent 3-hydroxy acid dehydrogenase YdfG